MDVCHLLERPSEPLAFGAHQCHGLPGRMLLVRAPWGVVEAHFVRHYWSARGAVLLLGAFSAHDLARVAHPGLSTLAVWFGILDHSVSVPLPNVCAAARAPDEVIDSPFDPAATARANLLIRLAQGVLLRKDATEGRLHPFLCPRGRGFSCSISTAQTATPRCSANALVAKPSRPILPPSPDARAIVSYHGGATHAKLLDSIAVWASKGLSSHAALTLCADLLADFAALGHDLERWLL